MPPIIARRPGRAWPAPLPPLPLWALCLAIALAPATRGQPAPAAPADDRGFRSAAQLPIEPPRPARRLALCVGIDHYQSKDYPPLACAVADAKALAAALAKAGYDVTLMTDDAADPALVPTYRNLSDQVYRFVRSSTNPDDTLVVSFAGHGDRVGGQAGLLPLDYGQQERMLMLDELTGPMSTSRCAARKKLLVLDACRSAAERPERRLSSGFLQSLGSPESFIVLAGCGQDQSSYEDAAAGHGRLTAVLLEAMAGKAFAAGQEFLLFEDLWKYVQGQFRERQWVDRQSPQSIGRLDARVRFDLSRRDLPAPPRLSKADERMYALSVKSAQDAWGEKDYTTAVDYCTTALRIHEGQAEALAVRAMAYAAMGYTDGCARDAEAALAADDKEAMALQASAFVARKRGDDAAELRLLRRADELVTADPARWPLLARGPLRIARLTMLAHRMTREAHPDNAAARAAWTRLLDDPELPAAERPTALMNRAEVYGRLKLHREEIADLTRAIEAPGARPDTVALALFERGLARAHAGEPVAAIPDYTLAIERADADRSVVQYALLARAMASIESRHAADTVADLTRLCDMPDVPDALMAHALVNRAAQYDALHDDARRMADYARLASLAGAPSSLLAWSLNELGFYHQASGQFKQAADEFTRLIAMPDAPPNERGAALFQRAGLRKRAGDAEGAVADFTALIELPGARPVPVGQALVERGWYYYESAQLDRALADSRRAMGLLPKEAVPAYNVAVILLRRGDLVAAGQAYQDAFASFGALAGAIDDLLELRDKLAGPPEADVFRGWLLIEAGKAVEGRAALGGYLKDHPDGPLVAWARELLSRPATTAPATRPA